LRAALAQQETANQKQDGRLLHMEMALADLQRQ
jgi:hypothetical protein